MCVQKFGVITPPETQALRNNPWARHRLLNRPNLSDLPGGLGNGLLDRVRGTTRQVEIHLT
jgi:hypothetical protein